MKFKHAWIVFKKEVKDIFRDRRTWIASILIPVLIFPLMFYLMGMGRSRLEKNLQSQIPIYIEVQQPSDLVDFLEKNPMFKIVEVEDPHEALQRGEIKLIVKIPENFQENIEKKISANILILYDEVSSESSFSVSNLENVLFSYNNAILENRLKELEIDPEILKPIHVIREAYVPEGSETKGSGSELIIVTFMLPFLLMLYPAVGGMPAAIDLGAGEKERMSLEPLLSTSADRLAILTGKYLTILLTSIIGVITSLAGLYAASKIAPEMIPFGIRISPLSVFILVTTSLLVATSLCGVMLSISVFAKSYKEAGTYLSPITIILMVPAYLTMFMDIRTLPLKLFFVPLLNAVLLMKEVLVDIIHPLHVIITFSILFALVIASIFFTRYMFSKESVIFRS